MFHVVFNAVVFIDHNRAIVLSPADSIMKNYTRTRINATKKNRGDKEKGNRCEKRVPPTPRHLITESYLLGVEQSERA